jgi:hypothetical protein
MQKLTAIFQPGNRISHREQEWIEEIFGAFIGDRIVDGEHKIVLDNSILFDAFIHREDKSYYEMFRGMNAFLVHFLDENYEGYYDLYLNFKGVYRNHWASVFNPMYVRALPYGYPSGFDKFAQISKASNRPFAWSFTGAIRKSSRPDMARAFAKLEPHYLYITDRLFDYTIKPAHGAAGLTLLECQRILLDSVFSPSPMGNINIECGRPYEALECGSIPIVERRIGLDYYRELLGPHPMPTVSSWAEARSIARELILNPHKLDTLQAECIAWWAKKKIELRKEVGDFLQARSADASDPQRQMFEPRANSNLWRCMELMRHHDLRAGVRRVAVMASRLAHGRPVRPGESREGQ